MISRQRQDYSLQVGSVIYPLKYWRCYTRILDACSKCVYYIGR